MRWLNNYFPATLWLGYHAIFPNWQMNFLSALMLVRALMVMFLFLIREMPSRRASPFQITIAWISTFLPVLMVWESDSSVFGLIGQLIAIAGMLLFTFTATELGKSFGVSPAIRSPVSSGIYKHLNHPMYVSHVVVEAGILIASPSVWNFAIAGLAWLLYALRARWELELIEKELSRNIN